MLELADWVKARLEAEGVEVPGPDHGPRSAKSAAWDAAPGTLLRPDGYNLASTAARGGPDGHAPAPPPDSAYLGDHDDPRGGVRWIFPEKPGTGGSERDTQRRPPPAPSGRLAWTVWGLGAALYLIGFYQRVAPAVMTAELTGVRSRAAGLGNLSAFYFYSYVAMQVPTGILADRWDLGSCWQPGRGWPGWAAPSLPWRAAWRGRARVDS